MEKKIKILFKYESGPRYDVLALPDESVLEAARKAGVALDSPCGGKGTCGKCRVRVLSGSVSTDTTNRKITSLDFEEGWRLACLSYPESDIEVSIPETARAFQNRIKVETLVDNAAFAKLREKLKSNGLNALDGIKLVKADLEPPSADNPAADRERLLRKLNPMAAAQSIELYALRKLPAVLRESGFSVYCVLRQTGDSPEEFTLIDVFSAKERPPVIAGLAVDIGTTTVSALLVDLSSGDILASGSAGNAQIRYGADVINRIIESTRPGGLERLRQAVTGECLCPLISALCETAGVAEGQIYRAAIAANTTMTHLFLGVSPEYLRLDPYTPAFFEYGPSRCDALGLPLNPGADILIAPSIGSYVGGDITAGVYSSMAFNTQGISLLIDLGTNGELVLGNEEFLVSCACSAGPAFEGGEISHGMRATDGAIEACVIDAATMEPRIKVIGDEGQKPLGLCGSGLIDIAGELFRCGIIDARGKFCKEGKRIHRDEWDRTAYIIAFSEESADGRQISLNEVDIDNLIRAKGAIFSAIRTMLASLDFDVSVIENVYVAGGIGSGINMRQAIRIGMLPNIPVEKYHYIGNTSLHGAYSILVSKEAAGFIGETGKNMTYIELSTHPGYMDEFVAACFLPHTNGGLFD
jgi:uncharacterized 2Fe-2S/4Fe-4S cluster protein (DUF4445 family)